MPIVVAYKNWLDKDPMWALEEGARFFRGESEVNATALV